MRIVIDTKALDNVTIGQVKSTVVRSPLLIVSGFAKLVNKAAVAVHQATATQQKPVMQSQEV